eukprot:CAMPEP_0170108686 /NCGR_PEP_ID=MMETSP0020_2-20130122/6727_1 /TAXON_ID=98059 /ORGANISM="Dinobryon sp., Strain UTEXLB2267" /LENGTH=70 /DNA_ID=CAMNT_0010333471 /DNA_START=134 /DNA_END=349 /DNA_ORIENTATION=-
MAVTMVIDGYAVDTALRPWGQETTVKKWIFSSFTPLSSNTFTAHLALPPVPNIGSNKTTFLLAIEGGNLE